MAVDPPSTSLRAPATHTLEAGSDVHRIHLSMFGSKEFNPCMGGETRFAPVFDTRGNCVPTMYGGSTFDAAAYETLFHDVGLLSGLRTVPKRNLDERSHSVIKPKRDFSMARLFGPDLLAWETTRASLINSPASEYSKTVLWAEAIHAQFPYVDGLVWTSNQCDPDLAFVFFGDRVTPGDFDIEERRDGTSDPSFLIDAREAGLRGDITFVL